MINFQARGQENTNSPDSINVRKGMIDSTVLAKNDTVQADSVKKAKKDTMISPSALTAQVQYSAKDSVVFNLKEQKAIIYDKGKVNYKKLKLEAGKIILDWNTNTVHAKGLKDSSGNITQKPVFTENNQKFKTDSMDYNFNSKKGKLYGLKTKQGEGYLHGEEVKKDQYNIAYASEAKYTTCNLDDPHFYISAKRIKAIPNDKIISGPAQMVMGDVPLPIILPFGFFPNTSKQSSGLILPGYGESTEKGFFLRDLGYYWGVSDKLDFQFMGTIYSNGSWRGNVITRYDQRYQYSGRLNLEYGIEKTGIEGDPNYSRTRSYIIKWQHSQDPKARPYSRFSADVNISSQNAYENQIADISQRRQNALRSSINYSTSFPGTPFSVNLNAGHEQNLSQHTFNLSFPKANINMTRQQPFRTSDISFLKNMGVNYGLNFSNNLNTTDTALFERSTWAWDNWKSGMQHTASVNTSVKALKYFSLSPSFNYRESFFFEKQTKYFDHARDTLITQMESGFYSARSWSVNAELSTNIYGTFNINKGGIVAVRHALTPSFRLSYSPNFGAPRFNNYKSYRDEQGNLRTYSRYIGAYGNAPRGENGSLGINLQNNLEMKVKNKNATDTTKSTKKINLIDNFNINTNYNFLADSFKLSPINITANTNLLDMFRIQFGATLDPYYLDPSDSTIKDRFSINETGKLGRITSYNISVNTNLNPKAFNSNKHDNMHGRGLYPSLYSLYYVDFDVPWNLNLGYNIRYSKPRFEGRISNHNLSVGGNVSLTDKWKISTNTSYNLKEKQFAPTDVSIHRDLHCWEMSFRWQPFTDAGFYMFRINAKSSLLKDLKYEKKSQNY